MESGAITDLHQPEKGIFMMNDEENANIADALGLTEEERAALDEDGAYATTASPVEQDPAETVELRADPAPVLKALAPQNAASILARVDEFEELVQQQFDEGEITTNEFRDYIKQARRRHEEVRWEQQKAELSRALTETAESNAWFREVDRFMATTGANIANSKSAKIAFDEHVKAVTSDPANQKLSDRAQLEKAHKLFVADFGSAFGGPAHQPAGDGGCGDLGGGDYATLDRLADTDPLAYESALASMSPDDRNRYGR